MIILSPQHMTIPANAVCHSQLINGFTQTQHQHKILRYIYLWAVLHTLLSSWIILSLVKFPSHFLSGTMHHLHTVLLVLHNTHKQPLSALEEISLHSINLTHPHLVLAVTAASHPPPALTQSPRYVTSLTISTSSHHFSSCFTVSPIFPSHFLHVKYFFKTGVTLFTPAHLPWIHLPHRTRKIKLAFTLKLQTTHGSTLLLDMPSFVMTPLAITSVFPILIFKLLLSKASLHFIFHLIAHSNTFLGNRSKDFSRSTKHIHSLFPLTWYSSGSLLKIGTA